MTFNFVNFNHNIAIAWRRSLTAALKVLTINVTKLKSRHLIAVKCKSSISTGAFYKNERRTSHAVSVDYGDPNTNDLK